MEEEEAREEGRDTLWPRTKSCRAASSQVGVFPLRLAERRTAAQERLRETYC